MPEDICRRIEVVDGHVVFMEAPSLDHQDAAGLLWTAFRADAAKYAAGTGQCLKASYDANLRWEHGPLHHRRPDVIVFRCVDRDTLIRPADTLLVVEVVSPTSRVRDKIEKLAVYAEVGVPHYWTVETRDGAIATVIWYALPEGEKRYQVRACWTPAETPDGIRADEPFPIRIAWEELVF